MPIDSLAPRFRDLSAGLDPQFIVQNETPFIVDALRNQSVVVKSGARMITLNPVGNLQIPRQSTVEVPTWASTENQTLTSNDFQFDAVDVSFSRVSAVTYASRQLLQQCTGNRDLLGVVSEHLTKSIAHAIDQAVLLGNGLSLKGITQQTGSGLVQTTTISTSTPTWTQVVNLDKLTNLANVWRNGSETIILDPNTAATWQTAPKTTAGSNGFLADSDYTVNGAPLRVTNTLTGQNAAIWSSRWDSCLIFTPSGISVLVDPFSKAEKNQVRIVVDSLVGVALIRPQSFVVATLN